MNVAAVKQELTERYPGIDIKDATVIEGVVTEIVGEIDRKLIESDRDVAVVIADRSAEHWHDVITEEYKVIKGGLRVYRNGEPTDLKPGETITVKPGTRHWVEGDETWFFCYSVPDWFPGDYHTTKGS